MGKKHEQKQLERDKGLTIRWKEAPEEHDYSAALLYLGLLMPVGQAKRVVVALRVEEPCAYKPPDLLRAAQLPLLPRDDALVTHNIEKVREGESLAPILLVRGNLLEHSPLVIADGHHRICTAYYLNEDFEIPCRLVDWPPLTDSANG